MREVGAATEEPPTDNAPAQEAPKKHAPTEAARLMGAARLMVLAGLTNVLAATLFVALR